MTQGDHKAAQDGEADEERGVLFPAREQSAMVAQPGDGSFDDQASAVATQSSILSGCVRPAIGTVGQIISMPSSAKASSKAAES